MFSATIATGSTPTAPQVVNLAMPPRVVERIRVRIPPGPRGELGWALGAAGTHVLPVGAGQYIVGNDEEIEWDLQGQITSGAWQLFAYNTGQFPHTLLVTFLVDPPQLVGAAFAPPSLAPVSFASTVVEVAAPSPEAAILPSAPSAPEALATPGIPPPPVESPSSFAPAAVARTAAIAPAAAAFTPEPGPPLPGLPPLPEPPPALDLPPEPAPPPTFELPPPPVPAPPVVFELPPLPEPPPPVELPPVPVFTFELPLFALPPMTFELPAPAPVVTLPTFTLPASPDVAPAQPGYVLPAYVPTEYAPTPAPPGILPPVRAVPAEEGPRGTPPLIEPTATEADLAAAVASGAVAYVPPVVNTHLDEGGGAAGAGEAFAVAPPGYITGWRPYQVREDGSVDYISDDPSGITVNSAPTGAELPPLYSRSAGHPQTLVVNGTVLYLQQYGGPLTSSQVAPIVWRYLPAISSGDRPMTPTRREKYGSSLPFGLPVGALLGGGAKAPVDVAGIEASVRKALGLD